MKQNSLLNHLTLIQFLGQGEKESVGLTIKTNPVDCLTNSVEFKINVFYVALDSVLAGISLRFRETRNFASAFSLLWRYVEMEETKLNSAVKEFAANYATDVSPDLLEEMIQLRHLHRLKFGDVCLSPLDLLYKLRSLELMSLFPNLFIALIIFCCLPVTVASAERPFSKLNLIKNFTRTTMGQVRLNDLAVLSLERDIARKVDLQDVINTFVERKALLLDC